MIAPGEFFHMGTRTIINTDTHGHSMKVTWTKGRNGDFRYLVENRGASGTLIGFSSNGTEPRGPGSDHARAGADRIIIEGSAEHTVTVNLEVVNGAAVSIAGGALVVLDDCDGNDINFGGSGTVEGSGDNNDSDLNSYAATSNISGENNNVHN